MFHKQAQTQGPILSLKHGTVLILLLLIPMVIKKVNKVTNFKRVTS
jgi:hypothetical protein